MAVPVWPAGAFLFNDLAAAGRQRESRPAERGQTAIQPPCQPRKVIDFDRN